MIKMIVMDMDGTLLNNNDEITSYTKEILMKAQKKGIRLVLSSGRSYLTLTKYGDQLNMKEYGGYYICANGIALYNCETDENKYLEKMHNKDQKRIFDLFKDENVEIMGVNDGYIYEYVAPKYLEEKKQYIKDNNLDEVYTGGPKGIIYDQRKNKYEIEMVKNFDNNGDVNKVIIAQNEEELQKAIKGKEIIFEEYSPKFTTARWLELSPKGVSKGNTLKRLCAKLNIDINDVMVFGDGENDLSMLEVVEESVCLLNGMDTVKAKTKYITEYDNDHDGLAKFVLKNVL